MEVGGPLLTMNFPSAISDSAKSGHVLQEEEENDFVRMNRASGQACGKTRKKDDH
jgi:hypothetical protein